MGKKTKGKEFRGKAGLGRVKGIWRTWADRKRRGGELIKEKKWM